MIVLIHQENTDNNRAILNGNNIPLTKGSTVEHLKYLAFRFPNEWIGWTDKERKLDQWDSFYDHKPTNYTALSKGNAPEFLNKGIGYVEDTPFINFKENQWFPTWVMSIELGMIHSSILNKVNFDKTQGDFEYDLNLLTRTLQSQGLFCYSNLCKNQSLENSNVLIYKFVAQTKKNGWILFLLLCHLIYERRFPFLAFAKALFHKKQEVKVDVLDIQKNNDTGNIETDYDVIIPTMGRASYLKNVLRDLSVQTVLPVKVIIIEQNGDTTATTDLDYLKNEEWPFQIDHQFIHQTGACNARNIALTKTSATWTLFFDDDNRFEENLLERIFKSLSITNARVLNMAYLQNGEIEKQKTFKQWPFFGSGCSIVNREVLEKCNFDMALEHGYGEDVDYGMQIRNAGYDVIYAPQIQILHLKAPIGGFRKPHVFPWHKEDVQPKPSPQIMYYRKKNYTHKQLLGYKMVQFFKTYGAFETKIPWKHYAKYKQAWSSSQKWANKIN
ncbi:glycosyltransferase family 2 protein [Nonlabens sp. Asnod3-A02]|uniref:glycosyltransferase family 2 protein n=1 Tax=Nonlabens sp. Asnod3-A02 TaxID=3160579 RepID=UPI00386345AB